MVQHLTDKMSLARGFAYRGFLCRQVTTTPDGLVRLEVNIAARNHREAALSIALALFVIIELTIFISVLNNTAMDLLVKPVAHILHVIKTQAQKVMAALDQDEVWCLLAYAATISLKSAWHALFCLFDLPA